MHMRRWVKVAFLFAILATAAIAGSKASYSLNGDPPPCLPWKLC
jgi:hypothetical protein